MISFGEVQPIVKASVAPFTPAILELPEVKFFVQANPEYARGDELAMIAKVDLTAARRVLGRLRRRRRRHRPAERRPTRPGLSVP